MTNDDERKREGDAFFAASVAFFRAYNQILVNELKQKEKATHE